jgi:hypothetical protein
VADALPFQYALVSFALAGLLATATGYLLFAPPASRPKRLLAAALGLLAVSEAADALRALTFRTESFWAWSATMVDLQFLQVAAMLGFLWWYPTPARWRSRHGAVFAVALSALFAAVALWLGARGAALDFSRGHDTFVPETIYHLPIVATGAALVSSLLRASVLPARERRAAQVLLPMLFASNFGLVTLFYARSFVSGHFLIPGGLGGAAVVVGLAWTLLFLGVALWQARRGVYVALALVAFGALWWGFTALVLAPAQFNMVTMLFTGIAPFYVVHGYGAFGGERLGVRATAVVAAVVFGAGFLPVTSVTALGFAGSPFGLGLGVLLGLAFAGGAVYIVFVGGRAWDAADPDRRLGPYRAAMQGELASGLQGPELWDRLRPLRAELGVSDQEHAAMVYMLRAAGERPSAHRLEPGGFFLDRYRVLRELGTLSHSATYLCRDEVVRRDVVLKSYRSPVPTPDGLQVVLREAQAIAAVHHPNVVTLLDLQQVGDQAFIVMEHMEGGSLADRLARGPLAPGEFRDVALGTLHGLEAVHAAGLVHRDVKPGNILLGRDGQAKLADFGVAHIRGFETTVGGGDGEAVGTVRFMSPEQAKGRVATVRSDLFSAGAALYEACTGQPYLQPRPGESAVEVQLRAARGRAFPTAWRGPPGLTAWFAKALDPAPAERFASAAEMREALERALDAGTRAEVRTRGRRAGSAPRR